MRHAAGAPTTHPHEVVQDPLETFLDFVLSANDPLGLGEPALPPSMPALTSAICDATVRRARKLTLTRTDLSW